MLTLIVALVLSGFYCAYLTSKRAAFSPQYRWEFWLKEHHPVSNTLAIGLLLLGGFGCLTYLGVASGIFSYLVIMMTAASLVFLLRPLAFFPLRSLLGIGMVSLGVELSLILL